MSSLNNMVAAAIFNEGWTCTAHEPEGEWGDCPGCRESLANLSGVVVAITLDAAREAVLLKHPRCTEPCEMCAEMDDWLTAIDELREEAK